MKSDQSTVKDIITWLRDQKWQGGRAAPTHFAREIERKWVEPEDLKEPSTQTPLKKLPSAAIAAWEKGLRGLAYGYVCSNPRRVSSIREGTYVGCGGCLNCQAFKQKMVTS